MKNENYSNIKNKRSQLRRRKIYLSTHIYLNLCLYLNMARGKWFIARQTFIVLIDIMQVHKYGIMQQPYDGIRIKAGLFHRTIISTSIRKLYNLFLCWLSIKCKYDINASLSRCIDYHLFFNFNVCNIV